MILHQSTMTRKHVAYLAQNSLKLDYFQVKPTKYKQASLCKKWNDAM